MDMNSLKNTLTTAPNFSRVDLQTALRSGTADVTFIKKDGTKRVMKCTLQEEIAVPYEKKTDRTREVKDHILPVWDLEANAWKSINMDTIEDVKIYGAS